jgi:hypothetical protein
MRTTLKLWNSLKTLSKQRFSIFLTMFSVILLTTFKFVCITFIRKMVGISNTSYHNLPLFFFYFKKIHVKISSSFFVISFTFETLINYHLVKNVRIILNFNEKLLKIRLIRREFGLRRIFFVEFGGEIRP